MSQRYSIIFKLDTEILLSFIQYGFLRIKTKIVAGLYFHSSTTKKPSDDLMPSAYSCSMPLRHLLA